MARGGARARSGPVADLDAFARERDGADWVVLPDSWPHDSPEWPLDDPNDPETGAPLFRHERELELWDSLWGQGQAPAWILDKQETAVALYVRLLTVVEATISVKSAPLLAEMRRQQEMLGLSTDGLLRNKWRFSGHKEMSAEVEAEKAAAQPAGNVTDLFSGVKVRGA
ncbi:hypothetical protein AB4Z38_07045 [Arthrobacter sp. 2RAF6]|uniref:hypothetical protein n=1 Tax=Arthrobacter sp. 2RAF6 TaxID=3233002 RepID=UPI003F8FCA2E